uniref:NADH dehydrogenase subunit 3 n=1 Tax=Bregmatothrips sinensis TaxID=3045418 RepID=UPI0030DFC064
MLWILMIMTMFLIVNIFLILTMILSKKSMNKKEKWVPFECGFNFFNFPRMPFSMRFFLIAIIFIIFDVEISLIIPSILTSYKANMIKWFWTLSTFLLILSLGIIMEYKENSFEWKY